MNDKQLEALLKKRLDEFLKELQKDFVLIPKQRLWHFLGGAVSFAVLAFGLSFAGVLAGMKASAAVRAEEKIVAILAEVERYREDLGIGSYIRFGDSVALRTGANVYLGVTGGRGQVDTGKTASPRKNARGDEQFIVERTAP